MTPPETLETARLLLRKPRYENAAELFVSYAQDPMVTRYLTWRPHTHSSEAQAIIERYLAGWQAQTEFSWLIFRRATAELIGCVVARKEDRGFNLGYVLARSQWGQGFMAEVITVVYQWAFNQPWVSRVWAFCDTENQASMRVLEKTGFEREGLLARYSIHPNISSEPRDCYVYARTRSR